MIRILIILACGLLFVSCKNEKQHTAASLSDVNITDIKFKNLDSAVLASGRLLRADSFPSKHITPRPVDVWLPNNYSEEKKYAVLYMHDGQMLFDSTTTWNKQEWKVDEWATQLMDEEKTKDFIVVAVHNIPDIRWQDLFPEKAFYNMIKDNQETLISEVEENSVKVQLNGDNYLKFLTEELKPVIDSQFSVYSDRAYTFVMGSSMGGLMSMYAISEYPNIFGAAACVSTHWPGYIPKEKNPVTAAIFSYMKEYFPEAGSHKVYFDYGNKTLDQYYPQYAPRVDAILKAKGYTETDSRNLFFDGTDHSENSWNQRLDTPLVFLLGK